MLKNFYDYYTVNMIVFFLSLILFYIILTPLIHRTYYKKTTALSICILSLISTLSYNALGNPAAFWLFAHDSSQINLENHTPDMLLTRLEERLRVAPHDIEALKYSHDLYLEVEKYEEAIITIQKIIAIQGKNDNLLAQYGTALVLQNKGLVSDEAIKKFTQSLFYNNKNIQSLYYLGLSFIQSGQYDKTAQTWKTIIDPLAKTTSIELSSLDKDVVNTMISTIKNTIQKQTISKSLWLLLADSVILLKEKDTLLHIQELAKKHIKNDPVFLMQMNQKITS